MQAMQACLHFMLSVTAIGNLFTCFSTYSGCTSSFLYSWLVELNRASKTMNHQSCTIVLVEYLPMKLPGIPLKSKIGSIQGILNWYYSSIYTYRLASIQTLPSRIIEHLLLQLFWEICRFLPRVHWTCGGWMQFLSATFLQSSKMSVYCMYRSSPVFRCAERSVYKYTWLYTGSLKLTRHTG